MTRALLLIFVLVASACDAASPVTGDDTGDDVAAPDAAAWHGDGLPPDPLAAHPGVVVYWGQNGWGGAHPGEPARWEAPLADVCAVPAYDVVVIGFVTTFVSTRNGGLPETNFASHCDQPVDAEHPFLLGCPEIGDGIAACHAAGKKVLLSLGGAAGAYGFTDDAQAEAFADTVWDLFLGGAHALRPFGAEPLDGVDLDVEGGGSNGYAAFVERLRARMDTDGDDWLITAAPQCPFPDAYLGPAAGHALGDAADAFDYLFVQFYNNYCAASSGTAFTDTWTSWRGVGPRLVVGLPAAPEAAPAGGYISPDALAGVLAPLADDAAFAGVMLWDASFDQNSGTETYGARAAGLLE